MFLHKSKSTIMKVEYHLILGMQRWQWSTGPSPIGAPQFPENGGPVHRYYGQPPPVYP